MMQNESICNQRDKSVNRKSTTDLIEDHRPIFMMAKLARNIFEYEIYLLNKK